MRFSTLVFACFCVSSVHAKMTRYDFRDAGGRNLVHFVSDAFIEKTIGLSSSIAGWLELDPDKLSDPIRGEFEVDVRTFHTGVELRNDYLKEKFLSAAEYPIAAFKLTRVKSFSKGKLEDNVPVTLRAEGTMSARGLSKPQIILIRVLWLKQSAMTKQRLPGNLLKVSASFDVDGALYNVQIPEPEKARFARFVQVSVDAVGTDNSPDLDAPKEAGPAKEAKLPTK